MAFKFSTTRRQLIFLGTTIASAFSTAIVAQAQSSSKFIASVVTSKLVARADGFSPIGGSVSLLEKAGQVLTNNVLIVRNRANQRLVAVSPICPHRQCTVAWKQNTQRFVCPCHGAEFSADGKVVKGPAQKSLKAFNVKIENNRFWIKPK